MADADYCLSEKQHAYSRFRIGSSFTAHVGVSLNRSEMLFLLCWPTLLLAKSNAQSIRPNEHRRLMHVSLRQTKVASFQAILADHL